MMSVNCGTGVGMCVALTDILWGLIRHFFCLRCQHAVSPYTHSDPMNKQKPGYHYRPDWPSNHLSLPSLRPKRSPA